MRYARKKKKIVSAWQLGAHSRMEEELLQEGTLIHREDGTYELFSLEAANGNGEIADVGDYFKVETINGEHYPFPNTKEYFEENHIKIGDGLYETNSRPVGIWMYGDEMVPEIKYLIEKGKLVIDETDDARYFNARLWGSDLSAARDAVVVFYNVERDASGDIREITFNFVAGDVFERTYEICSDMADT